MIKLGTTPVKEVNLALPSEGSRVYTYTIDCVDGQTLYADVIGNLAVEGRHGSSGSFVDLEGPGIDLSTWAGTAQDFEVRITAAATSVDLIRKFKLHVGVFADVVAPSMPTDLVVTPGVLSAELDWTASTDAVGVTGYRYRKDGGSPVDMGMTKPFTVTPLTADVEASFEIDAYDAAGNFSGWSDPALVTPTSGAVTFFDDFNDNSIDTAKWLAGSTAGINPITIAETSQQLWFQFPATYTALRYGWLDTVPYLDFVDKKLEVDIVNLSPTTWGRLYITVFTGPSDSWTKYMELDISNTFVAESWNGISGDFFNSESWDGSITKIRISHRSSDNKFVIAKYDGTWTDLYELIGWDASLIKIEVGANISNGAGAGAAPIKLDNFNTTAATTTPPVFADDFDDNSIDTVKWPTTSFTGSGTHIAIVETSQQLQFQLPTPFGAGQTAKLRSGVMDFTDRKVELDLVDMPIDAGASNAQFSLTVKKSSGAGLADLGFFGGGFFWDVNNPVGSFSNSNSSGLGSVTKIRIRHRVSDGKFVFSTYNGSTWTDLDAFTCTWNVTSAVIILEADTYGNTDAGNILKVDNLITDAPYAP